MMETKRPLILRFRKRELKFLTQDAKGGFGEFDTLKAYRRKK